MCQKNLYVLFFKPVLDFILALIFLPFIVPIIMIAGCVIVFEDHGPVFYNAYRLGKNGKPFKMFKLRSMKTNAPDLRLEDGSTYNSQDDPRVTRTGRVLRKTSLDELPQIFNVLSGKMSFIGPRPDPVDWMEKYSEEDKIFLSVKPGISGYSQAYFRNSVDGITKLKNDVYYAKNVSFRLDVNIFFRTIGSIFLRKNINKL